MSQIEQPPTDLQIVSFEALTAIMDEPRLLRPGEDNDARNQRIAEEFEAPRQFVISGHDEISLGGRRPVTLKDGVTAPRRTLNAVLQFPDDWIPFNVFRAATHTAPNGQIGNLNYRFPRPHLIERGEANRKAALRLFPDVQIIDLRTDMDMVYSRPDVPPPDDEDSPGDEAPKIKPVVIRARFHDAEVAQSRNPELYARISNIGWLNQQTEAKCAEFNRAFPNRRPMVPNRFTILDNTHAELNGQPYDTGPLPTRIMHRLIADYFTSEVDVIKLENAAFTRDRIAVQTFVAKLAAQQVVHITRDPDGLIRQAQLLPTLFADLREPLQSPEA